MAYQRPELLLLRGLGVVLFGLLGACTSGSSHPDAGPGPGVDDAGQDAGAVDAGQPCAQIGYGCSAVIACCGTEAFCNASEDVCRAIVPYDAGTGYLPGLGVDGADWIAEAISAPAASVAAISVPSGNVAVALTNASK